MKNGSSRTILPTYIIFERFLWHSFDHVHDRRLGEGGNDVKNMVHKHGLRMRNVHLTCFSKSWWLRENLACGTCFGTPNITFFIIIMGGVGTKLKIEIHMYSRYILLQTIDTYCIRVGQTVVIDYNDVFIGNCSLLPLFEIVTFLWNRSTVDLRSILGHQPFQPKFNLKSM